MKKAFILIALLILPVAAQETKPEFKLIEFQMALLKHGPEPLPAGWETTPLRKQHIEYVQSLLKSGKVVIAGPVKDDPELAGVMILRTKSAEEAREWVMADPAVAARHFTPELHPWWAADVMKKTATPDEMTVAYLAFLVRGDKWTPERTPATEAIQKGHMENIQRLADLKKLVVAGPFGDNGHLRGIFVFKAGSLEEARALADTDPAVKAGRLALKIHPWLVPEGILP